MSENEPEISKKAQQIITHLDKIKDIIIGADVVISQVNRELGELKAALDDLKKENDKDGNGNS